MNISNAPNEKKATRTPGPAREVEDPQQTVRIETGQELVAVELRRLKGIFTCRFQGGGGRLVEAPRAGAAHSQSRL